MGRLDARAGDRQRAVSLPELLVVIAILALAVMVTVPVIADRVHDAKLRASVRQFTVALRAARMVAVSKRAPVTVSMFVDPADCITGPYDSPCSYKYTDAKGRELTFDLPPGVEVDGASSPTITFQPNGSTSSAETTILRGRMSGGTMHVWTVDTPLTGIPRVTHTTETEGSGSGY